MHFQIWFVRCNFALLAVASTLASVTYGRCESQEEVDPVILEESWSGSFVAIGRDDYKLLSITDDAVIFELSSNGTGVIKLESKEPQFKGGVQQTKWSSDSRKHILSSTLFDATSWAPIPNSW